MDLTAEEISIVRRARRAIRYKRLYAAALYLVVVAVLAFVFWPDMDMLIVLSLVFVASQSAHGKGYGAPSYEQLVELLEARLPPPDPIIAALENRDPTRTP